MTAATNPRTVSLCIFAFLASALITLAIKSSSHHGTAGWISSLSRASSHANKIHAAPRVAYATFLAAPRQDNTDAFDDKDEDDEQDGYYIGTRVLAYQLLHSKTAGTNSSIPFIVLCTPDVSLRKRNRLKKDGATVIVAESLNADWVTAGAGEPRWRDVMTKMRLWQMTQYSKILFIDADMLVIDSLDGVFYDEATLTQATGNNPQNLKTDEAPLPRTYMFAGAPDIGFTTESGGNFLGYDHPYPPDPNLSYLNCGFFVFTPSKELFDYYTSLINIPGRFDPRFPEQNLLNYAHRRDGNMPWKPLWYGWNVNWPTEKDWRGGARSFHAKYWSGDPSHDPFLKAIWKEQRAEMEGFHRGRDAARKELS
ncbi:nucleotide-diphospho-sugar transferase [Teratosphaeria nubilosa]|uniref:Nucleotide-diphospho-sugar transferase n=1 Tax=Teratosphaeria nubilosa TaxID=161662 RepID=A0A6G1LBG3_9PEZI|nr:nucleotide-diphospho-sugar transferase [Teratosphaeria nubilosa]